jgi:hypothetical protein
VQFKRRIVFLPPSVFLSLFSSSSLLLFLSLPFAIPSHLIPLHFKALMDAFSQHFLFIFIFISIRSDQTRQSTPHTHTHITHTHHPHTHTHTHSHAVTAFIMSCHVMSYCTIAKHTHNTHTTYTHTHSTHTTHTQHLPIP